jgi:hypothetical protein
MWPLNDAGMVSGLVCGALFGWVLESAGFGSPCKLTGQFRLNDWSVLKVMFTAIVVAALGLYVFQKLGWMQADAVFVPTALVAASALGGLLVGSGFAVGGYCPGTSVVGLFSGRMDALIFVLGLLLGTFAFAGLYGPTVEAVMAAFEIEAGDTVPDAWGLSAGLVIFIMGLGVVAVYVFGGRMEKATQGPVSADQAVEGAQAK